MTRFDARLFGAAAAVATTLACGDWTGLDSGRVTVQFASLAGSAASAPAVSAAAAATPVTGTNGTLTLEQIWLVADEFRLERADGTCDAASSGPGNPCDRFEAAPALASVSLDGDVPGGVTLTADPGTYDELKFETREPRADGTLLAEIRAQFPDWPEEASLLVIGTFTPADGGDPVAFRVFFSGEVRVELVFEGEPLVVAAGDEQTATVFVNPDLWFVQADGSVVDLTQFDFAATGEVVELEAKFLEGFTKIEVD